MFIKSCQPGGQHCPLLTSITAGELSWLFVVSSDWRFGREELQMKIHLSFLEFFYTRPAVITSRGLLIKLYCWASWKKFPWTKSRLFTRNKSYQERFTIYNSYWCCTNPTLLPHTIFQWFSTFWFPGLAWLHCVVSQSLIRTLCNLSFKTKLEMLNIFQC